MSFYPLPADYKEIFVIGACGNSCRVSISDMDTLDDMRRYIRANFHCKEKFSNLLFEVESNGVCKAEEVNILTVTLIDKEIFMIGDMIEEVVLGSVADVPLMEEEGELIVTCVNGVKCCVDVKTTDTLVDARAYVNEYMEFI
eukprot:15324516-Ditylum_brightwellii.AAC.1